MPITPKPGYIVDPQNPNAVIKDPKANVAPNIATPNTPAPVVPSTSSSQVRSTLATTGTDPASVKATTLADFQKEVLPQTPPPQQPGYVDKYTQLRADQGISTLEDQSTAIDQQVQTLRDALNKENMGTGTSSGAETQGVFTGRMNEKAKNIQLQIDSLTGQQAIIQSRLTTKNGFISTMMDLSEKDYTASKAEYDKTFTDNLQLQNAFSLEQSRETTSDVKVQNEARSMLSTMATVLKNNKGSWDTLSSDQQAQISDIETQAGLPQGTMKALTTVDPNATIKYISGKSYDAKGNEFVTAVKVDADGNPVTTKLYTGGVKVKSTSTGASTTKPKVSGGFTYTSSDVSDISQYIKSGTDSATKISNYQNAYDTWLSKGGLPQDFFKNWPVKDYFTALESAQLPDEMQNAGL